MFDENVDCISKPNDDISDAFYELKIGQTLDVQGTGDNCMVPIRAVARAFKRECGAPAARSDWCLSRTTQAMIW